MVSVCVQHFFCMRRCINRKQRRAVKEAILSVCTPKCVQWVSPDACFLYRENTWERGAHGVLGAEEKLCLLDLGTAGIKSGGAHHSINRMVLQG